VSSNVIVENSQIFHLVRVYFLFYFISCLFLLYFVREFIIYLMIRLEEFDPYSIVLMFLLGISCISLLALVFHSDDVQAYTEDYRRQFISLP
jgi:hypothetical protein